MILALILVNVFRPSAGFKLVSILTVVGVISVVAGILSLVLGGQTGVVNYMNSLNAQGSGLTYSSVASALYGGKLQLREHVPRPTVLRPLHLPVP